MFSFFGNPAEVAKCYLVPYRLLFASGEGLTIQIDRYRLQTFISLVIQLLGYPRANGAKRRSGRKPGARVTNFVLAELKVVARDR